MANTIRGLFLLSLVLLTWQCKSDSQATTTEPSEAVDQIAQPLPRYETVEALPTNEVTQLKITGRLQPLQTMQIIPEIGGKTLGTKKLLNEGIRYQKGELLVRIDPTQYQLNVQAQKAQFQSALVKIMSQIQLDYPAAHSSWDAYLNDFDLTSPIPELPKVDDAQLKYFLSVNGIFSSFFTIKSAEEQLPKYEIRAPFNGVIVQGMLSPGGVVSPGVPIASMDRSDLYELKASISSKDIQKLKVGQQIKLVHTNTGDTWTGRIHRFGATMDQGTQSVPVFIRLSGRGLRSGMYLEANLDATVLENVVALPLTALNRNNQVHYIKNTTIQLLDVKPLRYDREKVWVSGFQGGEQIIVEEITEPIVGSKASPK